MAHRHGLFPLGTSATPSMPNHHAPVHLSTSATPASTQTNTSTSASNGVQQSQYTQDLWFRHGQLKSVEHDKNDLIEDILARYEAVLGQCQNLLDQADIATRDQSEPAQKAAAYRMERDHLLGLLNRNPFVVMLIDGNKMLFTDEYIRGGQQGGQAAALILREVMNDWAPRFVVSLGKEFQLSVKIYANFQDLATRLVKAGIINSPFMFEDFARGFSAIYDLVDVGSGNMSSKLLGKYC